MDIGTFLGSTIAQAYITEAVRQDIQVAQPNSNAVAYFPRVLSDETVLKRRVVSLAQPIIAADVAPLSTGRMGSGLRKQEIGGSLIDSAARYDYQGKDIEDLRTFFSLVRAVPGTTLSLTSPISNQALASYFEFVNNHVLQPLYMNMDRKDWTLLRTGKAWPDGSRDDDFTRPALLNMYNTSQTTIIASGNSRNIYNGPAADFLEDAQGRVTAARARGWRIREMIMNSNTRTAILALASTRTAVGGMTLQVETGGQMAVNYTQGNATADALDAALVARRLPPIVIEDGFWRDQVRADNDPSGEVGDYVIGAYVPDGEIIFVPESLPEEQAFVQNELLIQGVVAPQDGRAKGIHMIGRPTAQDEGAKVYLFGPYYDRSENPRLHGSGIAAHMPFLAGPAGFEIYKYVKP